MELSFNMVSSRHYADQHNPFSNIVEYYAKSASNIQENKCKQLFQASLQTLYKTVNNSVPYLIIARALSAAKVNSNQSESTGRVYLVKEYGRNLVSF